MISRRDFMQGGFSALALGILSRTVGAQPAINPSSGIPPLGSGAVSLANSRPFAPIPLFPQSIVVDGLPFAPGFSGDGFNNATIPFHRCENCGPLPPIREKIKVAVVGGGISGLATAMLLERHGPVVFELHPRFGGNAQGETWDQTSYSLGNAYVITPDKGSFLERFYLQLGRRRPRIDLRQDFN